MLTSNVAERLNKVVKFGLPPVISSKGFPGSMLIWGALNGALIGIISYASLHVESCIVGLPFSTYLQLGWVLYSLFNHIGPNHLV